MGTRSRRSLLPRLPRTLTARLIAVAVALVFVIGLLVSAATAVVMSRYLLGQIDHQLQQSLQRDSRIGSDDSFVGSCPSTGGGRMPPGAAGTLVIRQIDSTTVCTYVTEYDGEPHGLTANQVRAAVKGAESHPTSVDIPHLGHYRLIRDDDGNSIAGLPLSDVDSAVRSLVLWELGLTLLGTLLAALAGDWLVRRQLKPLHAVAETAYDVTGMPLSASGQSIDTRVDSRYTDPQTEVGRVGTALNTLLDHVDEALDERHRSEQQVRQFVADASHELRTPLATIHGYAELSRRTPDDAEALSTAMAKVETEATRMSSLVQDMLLLARLDSGRPLAQEEVDLTHLILEAGADARVVGPDHKWQLDLPDEPVVVIGDEQRLHQAVTNLINNARRHTPAGTVVTLAVRESSAGATITVHDNGPGIAPALLDTVFERFTRGDSSRTRASGGAGLGLSLVEAIVEAHGGRVRVSSVPGDTTFTILLPTAP